ncbi:MAG: hypothetical protein ACR2RV_11360, partial [Verrucomicrobiales bacterium]
MTNPPLKQIVVLRPALQFISALLAVFPAGAELVEKDLAPARSGGGAQFAELTPEDTGVRFVNLIDESHPLKRLYISGFACGGVSLGDLD